MHPIDSLSFLLFNLPWHYLDCMKKIFFFFFNCTLKNHLWVSSSSFPALMFKTKTSGPGFQYPGITWCGYLTWAENYFVTEFFKIKCNTFKKLHGVSVRGRESLTCNCFQFSRFSHHTPPYTHTDTHTPTTQLSFKLHTNAEVLLDYRGYGDRANMGMCFKTANTSLSN